MDKTSTLTIAGFILIIFGGILFFCRDVFFNFLVVTEFPLTPTSKTFKGWTDPKMSSVLDIYFFNCTNTHELFDKGFKPKLVELGPYSFKEEFEKVNITWNQNGTVSYRRRKISYFDQENSVGSLDDEITTLNLIALTAAYRDRYGSFLKKFSLSNILRMTRQEIWMTKRAEEIIFEGYSDPLLTVGSKLSNYISVGWAEDRFAWLYNRNGSSDYHGYFNFNTGKEDISKIGRLQEWNFKNRTDFYRAECGMINGSDGAFYPPGQTREKPIEMYSLEICRSLKFDYSEDVEVAGIPGFQYVGSKLNFDNGDLDPNNWCNCEGDCVPTGAVNLSRCLYGAPLFASYPHYLYADPFFLQQVEGVKPIENKHRFYITLEPKTGSLLDLAATLQINLLLQSFDHIAMYDGVPRIFIPTVWFEQKFSITSKYAAILKLLLAVPVIGIYLSIGLIVLGLILVLFSLKNKYLIRFTNAQSKQKRLSFVNPELLFSVDKKPEPEEQSLLESTL